MRTHPCRAFARVARALASAASLAPGDHETLRGAGRVSGHDARQTACAPVPVESTGTRGSGFASVGAATATDDSVRGSRSAHKELVSTLSLARARCAAPDAAACRPRAWPSPANAAAQLVDCERVDRRSRAGAERDPEGPLVGARRRRAVRRPSSPGTRRTPNLHAIMSEHARRPSEPTAVHAAQRASDSQ